MAETDATGESGSVLTGKARAGAAIAAIGIVASGLALNFLTQLGAPGLGSIVFVVGFVTTIAALWFLLLRPLEFGGE